MPSESASAIELRGLTKTYGVGERAVHALRGLDLEVAAGEWLAVTGASGSGKSTLLHILGGLDRPTAGTARVLGRDLAELDAAGRTLHRRHTVGFVFQQFLLLPTLTALENVAMPLRYAGVGGKERRDRAAAVLERVGLAARLDHLPSMLSGGEQQRVALARALVGQAPLLLADEPTGNLDTETAAEIVALLQELAKERSATVLVVTHDLEIARRAPRTVRMRDGRLETAEVSS